MDIYFLENKNAENYSEIMQELFSSSQWLHGLRHGSAAARLLELLVWGHRCLSLVSVGCCQVEVSMLG